MKIAIPVEDNHMKSPVSISFGRAPYFLVYETNQGGETFVENNAASSAGGAGIKAAQLLVDLNVEALLTPRCGENAMEVFQGASIKVYKTVTNDLAETLAAFISETLNPLVETHTGLHHHGGK